MLILSGAPALSAFRQQRLLQDLQALAPSLTAVSAHWLHLVDTDLTEAPARLAELLTYGDDRADAADAVASAGRLAVVVPRPGTISPWSSKATDIARNCGLEGIERIERGIAYRIEGVAVGLRTPLLALLHDRMIETVLGDFAQTAELFRHFPPQPMASIDLLAPGAPTINRW